MLNKVVPDFVGYLREQAPRYLWLHATGSHGLMYRKMMRCRVAEDPKGAVGGFDEIAGYEDAGEMQFEFLREQGLKPDDRLLEIGCGVLRAGEYFIEYLDSGNYWAIDVSDDAIQAGLARLPDDLERAKSPTTICVQDLKLAELPADAFDVAMSNSVFSHVPRSTVEEALEHIGRVLTDDGVFYASYLPPEENGGTTAERLSLTRYFYDIDELQSIAADNGLESWVEESYTHPYQRLLAVQPA